MASASSAPQKVIYRIPDSDDSENEFDYLVEQFQNENVEVFGDEYKIYPPPEGEDAEAGPGRDDDDYNKFDPMAELRASAFNSLIALKYEPSAFMVAGTGAEPILHDFRQVQCPLPIIPGTTKCWKGATCHRTHGKHTEYQAPSGTMIASLLAKKPPLNGSFMGKLTFIINNEGFYLVPYSIPEPDVGWLEPDPQYKSKIGVEQLTVIEQELNEIMKHASFRKKLDQEVYVSGEVVVAYLGQKLGWKRAVILSKREDEYGVVFTGNPLIKIQLIDCGEICLVRFMNLSRLPWKFQEYPPMAYRCTFKDAPLEFKPTTKTFSKMLEKRVTVEVYESAGPSSPTIAGDPMYDYGSSWSRYGFTEKDPFVVELWMQKKQHGFIKKCKVSEELCRA